MRAFAFGLLYCVNVYALTSTTTARISDTPTIFFRSASASLWVAGALLWWLPLAAAQAAILIHARVSNTPAGIVEEPSANYTKLDSAASTDDEDPEVGQLTPKLDDPTTAVAEQERLLKQRPIYLDEASAPVLGKIVSVPTTTRARLSSPPPEAEPIQPVGPLAFQQVSLAPPPAEPTRDDAFSASVAKAMAGELDDL